MIAGFTTIVSRITQRWSNGYRFGPRYSYTSYNSLPRTYVSRYRLGPRYRYVYTDGYIYQVVPRPTLLPA